MTDTIAGISTGGVIVTASDIGVIVAVSMREKSQSVDVVSVTGVGAGISVELVVFISGTSVGFSNPDMRFMRGLSAEGMEDAEISVMGTISSIHDSVVLISDHDGAGTSLTINAG